MANALYDSGRDRFLHSNAGGWTQLDWTDAAQDHSVALLDNTYTVNTATHDFWDDASTALVGAITSLASHTVIGADGTADAGDTTISSVSGNQVTQFVILRNTGTPATSELIVYFDTAGATLPFDPNGSDVQVQFNASGVFKL